MFSTWLIFIAAASATTVQVAATSFERGSTRAPDEGPVKSVTLNAFAIDRTEVSIADFEQFVRRAWGDDKLWSTPGITWRDQHPGGAGRDLRAAGRRETHPVVGVNWYEAQAYCEWKGGSLPTEAQWERAACGPESQLYPWGNEERDGIRWSLKTGQEPVMRVTTSPVTEDVAPGPDGILHMSGNVWEWTQDWYHRDGYASADTKNPAGPKEGHWKSIRGGSFMNLPSYCTCTHREPATPDSARLTLGFRCAYSLD